MSKKLVAFFSAGGATKKIAEKLAEAADADLFEIVPVQPYTDADLDWRNSLSRSSVEMNDRNARPAIALKAEGMDQYDTIFIGFPIWWYREPSIIDTFMEAYDFSGKTIVPFATSGGSGLGDSGKNIQSLAKGAKVKNGKRFPAGVSAKELKDWAEQF